VNVFVLSTGRCGSQTFAKACAHLPGWTAGHESQAHLPWKARVYPDQHIEVDNRLSWFLGPLGERWGKAFYVHLIRDAQDTAESLAAWSLPTPERPVASPVSILRAYSHGIVMRGTPNDREGYEQIARDYVDTVTANIRAFLRGREYMTVRTGDPDSFGRFLDQLHVTDGREAAMAEWAVKHNARRAA
jgi:hypothetical protein